MAAAGLPEATEAILRELARSVAEHRRGGGALDALPARQQELLRAMDGAQRQFFLEALARADADEGRGRFRAALGGGATGGSPAPPFPTRRGCPRTAPTAGPEARRGEPRVPGGRRSSVRARPFRAGMRVRPRPAEAPHPGELLQEIP